MINVVLTKLTFKQMALIRGQGKVITLLKSWAVGCGFKPDLHRFFLQESALLLLSQTHLAMVSVEVISLIPARC